MTARRAVLCSLTVTAMALTSVLAGRGGDSHQDLDRSGDLRLPAWKSGPARPQTATPSVFARWADVPNTQSVTVNYTFQWCCRRRRDSAPPFNDDPRDLLRPSAVRAHRPGGLPLGGPPATAEAGGTVPNTECSSRTTRTTRSAFTGSPTATITYTENAPAPPHPTGEALDQRPGVLGRGLQGRHVGTIVQRQGTGGDEGLLLAVRGQQGEVHRGSARPAAGRSPASARPRRRRTPRSRSAPAT